MIVLVTFVLVVVIAVAASEWVARAHWRYMMLRHSRTGDVPPLADPSVFYAMMLKPWLWPFRAGTVWRAQTTYDRASHSDPELRAAQSACEHRQRVAVPLYLLGVVAILASTLIKL